MFSSHFRDFDEDPFFSGFSSNFPSSSLLALEPERRRKGRNDDKKEVARYENPFDSMFQNMNKMMTDMHTRMRDMENNPDAHMYSSSMVMSYQNDGKSKPKMMQASSSTRRAPGQVKETRKTYRDSESGLEKMAIGRHIGGKGHEIEKRRQRGGSIEEESRFYELNEDELPSFEGEWKKRTKSYTGLGNASRHRSIEGGQRTDRMAQRDAPRPVGPSKSGRQRH